VSSCPACATPLPEDARFCPRCGASTPTEISRETGAVAGAPPTSGAAEAITARRGELQRALGGGFDIRELIGQGGFGEVWAATDVKLKRDVAVKVLRSDLVTSASLLERFRREAEAAAGLRHPNIVPIYQVGEAEGLVYFVMPLVKGESLRALLERDRQLPVQEVVRILTEAASALDEAHAAGIVHRDIKPDNILLEGRERRVLLMDFGIAKSLEAQDGGLTGTGMVMGTPQYMSPEQASGEKRIDRRSDLYSLGVVAYQMLAGRLPFAAGSAQEMIAAHIATPPEPLAGVVPPGAEDVADAVMRLLAKKPEDRWDSAGAFAAAIRPLVPVSEGSPIAWVAKRVRRSARAAGHRIVYYVGALVLAVLALYATDRSLFRRALLYWRPAAPAKVPGPANLPRPGWNELTIGGTASLQTRGESLLILVTPGALSGPQLFDGRTWTTVAVRGLNVPQAVLGRDTIWFYAGTFGDRSTLVYALTRAGLKVRDTIPDVIRTVWGAGSVTLVATSGGRMLRGQPGAWHAEPTGSYTPAMQIWGDALRQVALGQFARPGVPDSLLVFNGLNWSTVDPRPDTTRWWVYNAGDVLADGTLLVAGRDCVMRGEETPCRGLIAELPPREEHWRPLRAPMPDGIEFMQILARGRNDIWLVGEGKGCAAGACLFRLSQTGVERIPSPRRQVRVSNLAFLRGEPIALDARGVVWALRGGSWGVLGEVPGWIARGSDGRDFVWGAATVVGKQAVGVQAIVSAASAGQSRRWILAGGRVFERACEVGSAKCSEELTELPLPSAGPVSAIAALDSGLVAAGPRGLIFRWRGAWQPMGLLLRRGMTPDSILQFSSGDGEVAAALSRSAVLRWDSGGRRWVVWQILPAWLGRPLRFAVEPRGSAAFLVGDAENAVLRASGEIERVPNIGTPAAVAILDDGRAVLAYPTPDDPLLGTTLLVTTPLGEGELRTRSVAAPYAMDVYWVGREDCGLSVAGSGRMLSEAPGASLPFADTASGTLELAGELPRGVVITIDAEPQTGRRFQLEPGLHPVRLTARGYRDTLERACVVSRRVTRLDVRMVPQAGGN